MKFTRLAVAVFTLAMGANVLAAEPIQFVAKRGIAGGDADALLTNAVLEGAIIDGIQSQGIKLKSGKATAWIEFNYETTYVPGARNFRAVSSSISLRDMATVRGKSREVSVCGFSTFTWRAGDSEYAHVEGMRQQLRDSAVDFAKSCLKNGARS